jgi:hypothetical protein
MVALVMLVGCTQAAPPQTEAPGEEIDSGKDDGLPAASIAPALQPLLAFLRDDKNLVAQLGPEGTTAANVKKRTKVVRYTELGRAVDVAARAIARKYQVATGTGYRAGNGLVDLVSVGDMYVSVKSGYGDDSFVDRLVVSAKRAQARQMAQTLLPEAAMVSADHASTTSTGNWVLVLGDLTSEQAIVMTVEYEVQ